MLLILLYTLWSICLSQPFQLLSHLIHLLGLLKFSLGVTESIQCQIHHFKWRKVRAQLHEVNFNAHGSMGGVLSGFVNVYSLSIINDLWEGQCVDRNALDMLTSVGNQ